MYLLLAAEIKGICYSSILLSVDTSNLQCSAHRALTNCATAGFAHYNYCTLQQVRNRKSELARRGSASATAANTRHNSVAAGAQQGPPSASAQAAAAAAVAAALQETPLAAVADAAADAPARVLVGAYPHGGLAAFCTRIVIFFRHNPLLGITSLSAAIALFALGQYAMDSSKEVRELNCCSFVV
jgi:predicted lipid-binding transport protein (Tim44 family)